MASCPFTILDVLSRFSVMTMRIPLWGKMSSSSDTEAQAMLVRGGLLGKSLLTTRELSRCAARLDTVMMEASVWLANASQS